MSGNNTAAMCGAASLLVAGGAYYMLKNKT